MACSNLSQPKRNGVVSEDMSNEAPIGLTFMEKLIGLLLITVGALWFYTTYTNIGSLEPQNMMFLGAALAMIILGIALVIARIK